MDEKHCKALRRPPELKQPCNDTPCPPRWNTSTFTPCSRTCGGGTQTRTVQCIQELGPLSSDLLPLPESSCSYPPPRTQVSCANLDCQPEWDAGTYGPCSRTCGMSHTLYVFYSFVTPRGGKFSCPPFCRRRKQMSKRRARQIS